MNSSLKVRLFALSAPVAFACLALSWGTRQDAQTRRPSSFTAPTDVVNSFQFSPDGRTLAIARTGRGGAGRVELWDVETGTLRHAIKGFDGEVWSVSFSPDGKSLVTGSSGYHSNKIQEKLARRDATPFAELKWWDAQTGELEQRVEVPGANRLGVKAYYSPNGRLLATVEYTLATTTFGFGGFDPLDGPGRLGVFPNSVLNSIGFAADLKLLDAKTGEVRLKLKSGLINYERPVFRGTGRIDPWTSMFQMNQRREPLVFSPNGELVAGWTSSELRLWNSWTGVEIRKLKNFKGRLSDAAFSPDSHLLAIGITEFSIKKDKPIFKTEIQIYDVADGRLTQTLPLATQSIFNLVFAFNGRQLLIAGWQSKEDHTFATLELLDIQTGSAGSIQARDEGTMSSAALSPNGALLAFQTDASTVKLVDTQSWRSRYTFDESSNGNSDDASIRRFLVSVKSVMALAFSADGKTVSGEIEHGGIKVWDARTSEVVKQFAVQEETGSIAAITSSGKLIAEAGGDETVRLWNLTDGEKKTLPTNHEPVSAVALSADGQTMAVAYPNRIALLKTETRELTRTLERARICYLVFSSDGSTLATADENGGIQIWDLASGQMSKTIASTGKVTALGISPNGRTLASASQARIVSIWDLQTGSLSLQLKKHSGAVNAIAFSPDGNLMATGGDDRSVIIWDTATGKARRTLKGHDLTVTSLAFSSDSSLLASGSGNASVVLWDVKSGTLKRVLR